MNSLSKRPLWTNEKGFSLIDVVVTVAIIVALSVGGFVAYTGLIDNAKQAAVGAAADQVYTAAVVAESDGNSATNNDSVKDGYEASTSEIKIAITGAGSTLLVVATNADNPSIRAARGANATAPLPPAPGPLTVASTNYVKNPSPAGSANSQAPGNWGGGGNGTAALVAGAAPDGVGSAFVKTWNVAATSLAGTPSIDFGGVNVGTLESSLSTPLIPGQIYTHSVMFNAPYAGTFRLVNVERNAAGVNTDVISGPVVTTSGPGWVQMVHTRVAGPNSFGMRGSIQQTAGTIPRVGDRFTIARSAVTYTSAVEPYFDGNTPDQVIDGVTYSYDWTGAENASSSTASYRP